MVNTPSRRNMNENQNAKCKPEDRFCGIDDAGGAGTKNTTGKKSQLDKEYSKEENIQKPKTAKNNAYDHAGKEGYNSPSEREGTVKHPKSVHEVKNSNDSMARNPRDVMGTTNPAKAFNETDLGKDLPNLYVEESSDVDPNQMSRSEEMELENNTELNMEYKNRKKANFLGNESLSDLTMLTGQTKRTLN